MLSDKQEISGKDNRIWLEIGLYVAVSLVASLLSATILHSRGMSHLVLHVIYFFFLFLIAVCVLNPWSFLYDFYLGKGKISAILIAITIIGVCVLCVVPMRINPYWNGRGNFHWNQRNQYGELADAILEGHLDVHRGEDFSDLMAMENPYDVEERNKNGVPFYWDHAFYNGHYYVYFGIVPAITLFIPYKLITGSPLTEWKATAVFSIFIIMAIFTIGLSVIRKLKARVPLLAYLAVCSGISFIILWFAIKYPALYCTAISAGVCFCLWSFCLFFRAFYVDEKPSLWKIALASLLGALVFGCRPPIGLMEVAVLPFIIFHFHRQIKGEDAGKCSHIVKQAVALILPYVIVAVLLMIYNYVRFDSPFEFGQTYQLTVADQSGFSSLKGRISLVDWINYTWKYLFEFNPFDKKFPWVNEQMGMLILFPLLAVAFLKWKLPEADKELKWFHVMLLVGCAIVIESQVLSSPFSLTRYWMDFTFALGVGILFWMACFYSSGNRTDAHRKVITVLLVWFSLFAVVIALLELFTLGDGSLADVDAKTVNALSRFFAFHNIIE